MSGDILQKIQEAIQKRRLLVHGEHALVAVSGGADSVTLLYALKELCRESGVRLTVAHMNHRIRGSSADEDALFVKELAAKLKIPCRLCRSDVPRLARQKGISIEMAARETRYEFFRRLARQVGASVVVTAHTADDQAETVLLKLFRGAGPRGLAGIPFISYWRGLRVARPMIEVSRQEVIEFLTARHLNWREDETNSDMSFLRNRVRHQILPLIEAAMNPKVRQVLAHTAELLREEEDWMDSLARATLDTCYAFDHEALHIKALQEQPPAIRRRVLRIWMIASGVPGETIDFQVVARVEALIQNPKGTGEIEIATGRRIRRQYARLVIEKEDRKPSRKFAVIIKLPGETSLPEIGLKVHAQWKKGLVKNKSMQVGKVPSAASLCQASIGRSKITVRSWLPGDRVSPLGMNGSKKIQDIFVDAKVPADKRTQIPIFECRKKIIWIPGYCVARGWEVQNPSDIALQLSVDNA